MRALIEIGPQNAERYLAQLLAIEEQAFSEPWSKEAYLTEIERPISHIVAMTEGDTLLGYAGFWQILDTAEINNVAVAEQYRSRGVGRMLMSGLLDLAALLGCSRCNLEVRSGNSAALALYEGLGFYLVGKRPDYYDNPTEDALLMTCDIAADRLRKRLL